MVNYTVEHGFSEVSWRPRRASAVPWLACEQVTGAQRQPPLGDVVGAADPPAGELFDLPQPVAEGLPVDVQFRRGVPPRPVGLEKDSQRSDSCDHGVCCTRGGRGMW